MGILSSACSLSQYTTSSDLQEDFLKNITDRVRYKAFIEIEQDSITEQSIGWVDSNDMLDNQFETVNFLKEPYIVLGMRVDKRAVPASILKRNCLLKEQQIMKEEGITFLNAKRRKDIKENVRQGLLSHILPTTQIYDMVWKYTTGHALFTSTSPRLCDEFQELFYETFNLRTNIIELSMVGSAILSVNEKSKALIEKFKYLEMPGSDFLSWLWYKYRDDNNEFGIKDGNKARLLFDDKVVLSHEDIDTPQTVTCIGDSQSMNEIQTALDDNKRIIQAKLLLTTLDGDWSLFLDAYYFDFKSIKTPKVIQDKADPDATFYEKISLIEEAITILNKIYGTFVLEYTKKENK